jgi:hypothetical protein
MIVRESVKDELCLLSGFNQPRAFQGQQVSAGVRDRQVRKVGEHVYAALPLRKYFH